MPWKMNRSHTQRAGSIVMMDARDGITVDMIHEAVVQSMKADRTTSSVGATPCREPPCGVPWCFSRCAENHGFCALAVVLRYRQHLSSISASIAGFSERRREAIADFTIILGCTNTHKARCPKTKPAEALRRPCRDARQPYPQAALPGPTNTPAVALPAVMAEATPVTPSQ